MSLSPDISDRSNILAAIERRSASHPIDGPSQSNGLVYTNFDHDHPKRQEMRRLIDPGITRPNPREVANNAFKTLLQLGENILDHPDEDKYQRFKPTNSKIKSHIIDPKGTLEYAIALGFRPQVVNFQPFYVWNKKFFHDLCIGVAVLKETMDRETTKQEQLEKAKQEEKAAAEAQIEKVKQAFLDDRKSRMLVDERERERLAARAARGASPTSETEISPPPYIPGPGVMLTGSREETPLVNGDTDDED